MAEKQTANVSAAQASETVPKPTLDSSRKLVRFIPYSAAIKVPAPRPSVPMLNLRSSNIRALRLASRMAFTLCNCVRITF